MAYVKSNISKLGHNKVSGTKISTCVDSAGTINDNGPGMAKNKIEIVAKENQTDVDSEVYYAMHSSKNKTPIMPNKTNKTLIPISFQFNIQSFIKTYYIKRENK